MPTTDAASPPSGPASTPPPRSQRRSTEAWVQVTLAVIVVALLLVVAAVPRARPALEAVPEQPAYELRLALAELRAAIAAYPLDHGAWPGAAPGPRAGATEVARRLELQLTRASDREGGPALERDGEVVPRLGPYLPLALPANPVNGLASVRVLLDDEPWPASSDDTTGWIYRLATGELRANVRGTVGESGLRYDQL